jgi:hypothetical protein
MYTFQAREISTKVSNIVASVMKTMSEKTIDMETQTKTNSRESKDQDAAITIIMAELAELLKQLTAATESTWGALNLLETIASKYSFQQAYKSSKAQVYLPWVSCLLTALFASIAVFGGNHNAFQSPGLDSVSTVAEVKSVCDLVNKNTDIIACIRNITLADLDQRFLALETALQNNDGRIDHVW